MNIFRIAASVSMVDEIANSLSHETAEKMNQELSKIRGIGKAAEILNKYGINVKENKGSVFSLEYESWKEPLRTHYLWMNNQNIPELLVKKNAKPVNWQKAEKLFGPFTKETD